MIMIVFSCQKVEKYTIAETQEYVFFILTNSTKDSIKIVKNEKPKLFFSLDTECPLCTSYSREINKLYNNYKDDMDFYGFFPSYIFNAEKMNQFIQKNYYDMDFIIDTNQILTHFLDAKVTPECFLIDKDFNIIYSGLINDWIKELSRKGQHINNHYLDDAINSYLNNL